MRTSRIDVLTSSIDPLRVKDVIARKAASNDGAAMAWSMTILASASASFVSGDVRGPRGGSSTHVEQGGPGATGRQECGTTGRLQAPKMQRETLPSDH